MRNGFAIAALGVLAGCSTIQAPSIEVAAGNSQIRLSVLQGNIESGVIGAGYGGTSCIVTVLGEVPESIRASLTLGDCTIEVGVDD